MKAAGWLWNHLCPGAWALAVAAGMCCHGCGHDVPMVSLGIDDSYTVCRMQLLRLHAEFTGASYRWTMTAPDGTEEVLSTGAECFFVSAREGTYFLTLEIGGAPELFTHEFTVDVVREEVEYSPYLSTVYEYNPAPGQFVNMMPEWERGDGYDDMLRKAEECIAGTTEELVSLGAFGGYITFGFDHTVVNEPGEKDFLVLGNSFYEEGFEDVRAGSCEPGIVMVSLDVNGNGVPDDPWYELAGSEYSSPLTRHGYSIVYTRPDGAKPPVPQGQYILDAEYIPWRDSEGNRGYVAKNFQHTQSYYPEWEDDDELGFCGTRLADNALDVYGNGRYFQLFSYPWGYADNHPNSNSDLNSFDIGWAVDSYGMPVHLPGADFIRVYTALNQYCDWIGETSTEIAGARDLHLQQGSAAASSGLRAARQRREKQKQN